jgi:FlaA1/EpsC-like NDP-sugar epimerase
VIGTSGAFCLAAVYQGVWRYTGPDNLIRWAKAVSGGTAFSALVSAIIYGSANFPHLVFFPYPVLLFDAVVMSRCSFRLFDLLISWLQPAQSLELVDE